MADEQPKNPLREITQPFIDLVRAPRALWGINLAYLFEGLVYFGILGYLAMYFNDYVGLNDVWAGRMVGVLTAGITIAMFFLGGIADKFGVRFALLAAFVLMIVGRMFISGAPVVDPTYVNVTGKDAARNDPVYVFTELEEPQAPSEPVATQRAAEGAEPDPGYVADVPSEVTESEIAPAPIAGGGPPAVPEEREADGVATQTGDEAKQEEPSPGFGSVAHILAMLGVLLVVVGYGMYQPGAYAAIRQFCSEKTAPMGFAMLYALMNLGGFIPTYAFLLRNDEVDMGATKIAGAGLGILGVIWVYTGLTVVSLLATWLLLSKQTVNKAIAEAKAERAREKAARGETQAAPDPAPTTAAPPAERQGFGAKIVNYIRNHPLGDAKFAFFIFALIPVQTLFAHNWLTLPMYVERAYTETWPWISDNFEPAVNFNPLLIFLFVPIVTALTQRAKVYNMMIYGTALMALPTFLLALGPYPWTLVSFIILMTIGEAMWQPRFLQYAAEIAPEGRTGAYMGVAQFPWFLTKVIVPLYSGWFLQNYVPEEGPQHSEAMWLIYASIACSSTVFLLLAKGWAGKDFRTKAA